MPAWTHAAVTGATVGIACTAVAMLGFPAGQAAPSRALDRVPTVHAGQAQSVPIAAESLFTLTPDGHETTSAGPARPRDSSRKAKPRCTKRNPCRHPATLPGGNPNSWAYTTVDADGIPVHWDRCKPIRFRINPAGATDRMLADLHEAIKRVAAASGLEFHDAGMTDVIPFRAPDWYSALYAAGNDAELYVAFSNGTDVPGLAGAPIGIGSVVWTNDGPGGSPPFAVLGGAVFDTSAEMINDGFGLGMTRGSLMLHELGHVMNLAHVSDPTQVMFPTLGLASVADYQAGDRNGLRQLAALPCG